MEKEGELRKRMSRKEKTEEGDTASTSAVAPSENSYYSMLSGLLSSGASVVSNTLYGLWTKLPPIITGIAFLDEATIARLTGSPAGQLGLDTGKDGLLKVLEKAAELAQKHPSKMCYFWLANKLCILVADPELIQKLRKEHDNKLSRRVLIFEVLDTPNILTFEGDAWSGIREEYIKGVQSSQHIPVMEKIANKHLGFLDEHLKSLKDIEDIDLHDFIVGYVIDLIAETTMGLHDNDKQTLEEMKKFFEGLIGEFFNFKGLLKWQLLSYFLRATNSLGEFNKKIRERFNKTFKIDEIKKNESLLRSVAEKLFSMTEKENPQKLESLDAEIMSQGIFLLTAGVVSSAATIEFGIKLLSVNPEVMKKLLDEFSKVLGDKEIEDITLEDIKKVKYLGWFIKEVLRLYPPVPLIPPRDVIEEFEFNGIKIPKDSNIFISPWVTHHMNDWGENVKEVNPDRFASSQQVPKGAYAPFGGGKRRCIGDSFADADMQLMLAKFILKYVFVVSSNEPADPHDKNKFKVTMEYGGLSLKEKLKAKLAPRQSCTQEQFEEIVEKRAKEQEATNWNPCVII